MQNSDQWSDAALHTELGHFVKISNRLGALKRLTGRTDMHEHTRNARIDTQ